MSFERVNEDALALLFDRHYERRDWRHEYVEDMTAQFRRGMRASALRAIRLLERAKVALGQRIGDPRAHAGQRGHALDIALNHRRQWTLTQQRRSYRWCSRKQAVDWKMDGIRIGPSSYLD